MSSLIVIVISRDVRVRMSKPCFVMILVRGSETDITASKGSQVTMMAQGVATV